jgi:hypothetical protein
MNKQTMQIIKILSGYQKATTPVNIMHAFRRAGIIFQWSIVHNALIAKVS